MAQLWEFELDTGPSENPVSLDEAKAACRVLHDDEDDYLNQCIAGAVALLDGPLGYLGQAIMQQTWTVRCGKQGVSGKIELPFGPVGQVTAIVTHDGESENTQDLNDFLIFTGEFRSTIEPVSGTWPVLGDREDALQVTFTAGAVDANAVKANIKQAILMLVAHWFRHRETVAMGAASKEVEFGLQALLVNERRF